MILKVIMYSYLVCLLLVVLFIIIEPRINIKPKGRFGKWWRKNVSTHMNPNDDVYS